MYQKIEDKFKKESPFINFSRIYCILAIVVAIPLFLLNFFETINFFWTFILLFLIIYIIVIYITICFKQKIPFKEFLKIRTNYNTYIKELKQKENDTIKSIINDFKIEKCLPTFIEHYKTLAANQKKNYSFFNALLSIFTFVISLYQIFEPDVSIIEGLAIIIFIIIVISVVVWLIIQIIDIKNIFLGNKDLYGTLEELFTEQYVEQINNEN